MKILLSLILLFSGVLLAGENTAVLPVKIAYATSHEKQTSDGKFFPWVAFDGEEKTRWASDFSDPQVLMADLGQMAEINKVIIKWETAAAKSYTIDISLDNKKWITVYKTYNGQGNTEEVTIKPIKVRYIRMFGMSRLTGFGYSIFEFKIYGKPLSAHAIKIDLDKSEQKDLVVSKRGDPELLQLPYMNSKLPIEKRIEDLLNRMSLEEKIIQVAGTGGHETSPNIRLGIPEMKVSDGPNGINCKINTAFPTGVTMGATWDPELINQVGIALGEDAKASGIDILLGPCINIHRIPLGGRNFESYSEDPYLVSRIVVPYVKGLQSQKVAASTKHFACNNQEWERGSINVEIDDRTLNEIYLPGFKAAVMEAGTLTVMGAYNKVNGYYCCENKILLEDILKKSWGFKGLVMSDWGATHSTINSANNGLDLEMPGPGQFFGKPLLEAVKNGEISESVINDKVSRILRVMFELGKFDNIRETVQKRCC